MTVLGDWGNLQNVLLLKGDVNLVKGALYGIKNPMSPESLTKLMKKALAGNKASVTKIESVLKHVFSAIDYINDVTAEVVERRTLDAIKQEITNMDDHMPKLKGIKAIYDEFMPAYKAAVVKKVQMSVMMVYNDVTFMLDAANPQPMPAHLQQLKYTCEYYANRIDNLKWQDPSGF
jgi:hypothetical protein